MMRGDNEEAAVVSLPTHITALSAPNAWSFNRPSDRRFVCVIMDGSYQPKRPEQSSRLPG
jgi:hypothetical protein